MYDDTHIRTGWHRKHLHGRYDVNTDNGAMRILRHHIERRHIGYMRLCGEGGSMREGVSCILTFYSGESMHSCKNGPTRKKQQHVIRNMELRIQKIS